MSHPVALAYVLPATPLQPRSRRSGKPNPRRPRISYSPHFVLRRLPTALADSGGPGGPQDDNNETDLSSAQPESPSTPRPNAWDGIKVWFARRDSPHIDENDLDDNDSSQQQTPPSPSATMTPLPSEKSRPNEQPTPTPLPPPRRGPPPQITVIPDITAATPESDASKTEGFRWPWTRPRTNSSSPAPQLVDQQQRKQQQPQRTTPSLTTKPPRVTHSDTKPGSRLDADPTHPRVKADPILQQRWKQVLDIIVPPNGSANGKTGGKAPGKRPQKSNATATSKRDVELQKPESPSTPDVINGPSRRRRGIMELYLPPSEPRKEEEGADKTQPWFGLPWKRESAEPGSEIDIEAEGGAEIETKTETEVGAEAQYVKGMSQLKGETAETKLESEETQVSDKKRKGWFQPPWGRHEEQTNPVANKGRQKSDGEEETAPKSDFDRSGERRGEAVPTPQDITTNDESGGLPNADPESSKSTDSSEDAMAVEPSSRENKVSDGNPGERETDEVKKTEEKVLVAASTNDSSSSRTTTVDMVSIPQRDVAAIRLIFGSETFFATEALSAPGGLIFRGNLRGEPKATLTKLEDRLRARLGDKYTLCLAEGEEDLRPVVVVVPTARDRRASTPRQKVMAVIVALMTVSTCLGRGMTTNVLRPRITANYGAPPMRTIIDRLLHTPVASPFAVATAIAVVVLASQLVQRAVAARHRTRIAIPYLLPSYQLGSFGAVVQLASPTPTRAALFDIAVSGAVMLVVPSLICLIIGLRLSTHFPSVVPVPMSVVSNSMLMGALTRFVPGGQILVDYARSLIGLHPLAVIGANCLTIAAFNLLPMRQLDGGRIISALYGRKTAVHASRVTVLFLLLATSKNPSLIVFLLAVMLGPWHVDRPAKNELTEPDPIRTLFGYAMMLLMVAILLPYPRAAFFGTL